MIDYSKVPLKVSVPLIMMLPVLFVASVLTTVSYFQSRTDAHELTRQSLDQIHYRIQGHVDRLLSAPGQMNTLNKSLVHEGHLPVEDLSVWQNTIIAQLQSSPTLSSIVFGAADGRATWICRYIGDDEHTYYALNPPGDPTRMREYRVAKNGEMSEAPSSTFDYDPRVRPWYLAPAGSGGPSWCEPFVFVGDADADVMTLGISYGEPLYDSRGELLGVIDADLSLNDISKYLEGIEIGSSGHVYLADRQGLLIGNSMGARQADAEGNRVSAKDSMEPWVSVSAEYIGNLPGSFTELSTVHEQTIEINGRRVLLVVSPYEHPTGLNWVLVTLVPESDFLSGVFIARQRGMLIAAIASVLMLLLGLATALWMVKPMTFLAEHVRRIGEGELDREIHLKQSPELVNLSKEINEMTAGLRDRMRIRHSLAVAMDVQQALLPDGPPRVQGLDIAGHSTYCDETGGDYYDFLDITGLNEESVCVALGDVMGHGVAAAMLMATARGILRSHSRGPSSLADLLGHLNQLLVPDTGGKRFMTMLLATLDARERVLRWASAGHEPPFYYEPGTGQYRELDGSGLPLGILQEEVYEEYVFNDVRDGQVFYMATDGVWELQGPDGEQFGKQRVRDLIQRHHAESAEVIGTRIREALQAFRGDDSRDDDVTFVIVRVLAR